MKIGIMGAGAVGCFVGGKLVLGGSEVTFVGRPRGLEEIQKHGMHLEDMDEPSVTLAPLRVDYSVDPPSLAGCDVILCAVKSGQTAEAGRTLAGVAREGTLVVSLQNGLRNADALRASMPRQRVLGGIVGFNVVAGEHASFRRATSGALVLEADDDPRLTTLAELLAAAGFDVHLAKDIRARQWSKLVMNLSNALGALAGVPLRDLLVDASYRRLVRALISEAIAVLRAGRIPLARVGALPIGVFPALLALPTPLFRLAARAQLRIDAEARSSMWQDLARGRLTEVDELNGEVVKLATASVPPSRAPLNQRLVELVHEAERAGSGSPNLSAAALWARLAPRSTLPAA